MFQLIITLIVSNFPKEKNNINSLPAQEENVSPGNITPVKDNAMLSLSEHAASLACHSPHWKGLHPDRIHLS